MHELGDSYDKGATQRDRLVDRRLTAAAAAKEDCAASHRYNSNSPRRCCRAVCILVAGTSEGTYSKRLKRQKSDTRAKKVTKGAKANTLRQKSKRWTIQLNSKSVSDWQRSSRPPRKGRMVRLYRYSSTSSTSTRRCSYLDKATGSSPRTYINFSILAIGRTHS